MGKYVAPFLSNRSREILTDHTLADAKNEKIMRFDIGSEEGDAGEDMSLDGSFDGGDVDEGIPLR